MMSAGAAKAAFTFVLLADMDAYHVLQSFHVLLKYNNPMAKHSFFTSCNEFYREIHYSRSKEAQLCVLSVDSGSD